PVRRRVRPGRDRRFRIRGRSVSPAGAVVLPNRRAWPHGGGHPLESGVRELATLIVTAGAVTFAAGVALWAWRLTAGARAARLKWQDRLSGLEARLARTDALFAAYPGLVLIWPE